MNSRTLKNDLLSATGIKKLHKKMFGSTWEWAGEFRKTQTNIGVAPANIQNDLGALLGDVKYWLDKKTFDLDEIAIRFHHRLVWIHVFPNGNGRHARLAANLLLKHNKGKNFSWGSESLVGNTLNRKEYIKALRQADKEEDYRSLLRFARN
jgi:Fic-DOC domain mobile mystery protein B